MRLNKLIIIGFFLVLIGAILPFVIVIKLLPSTFLLNIIAFVASTAGIFLGVIGVAMDVAEKRRSRDDWPKF